ncbi:MAG: DNA-protecting protein DprA, partial [bacterium]|nr:DNA-protecting protein DprA [bacterium]
RRARRTLAREAEREWRRCRKLGIRVLTPRSPGYPLALETLPDAPVVLYARGEPAEPVLRVAVVGSRSPTRYGLRVATGLADGLAAHGIEVVSGGARGVDTAAHKAALGGGGTTVAILGSGLCRPYPEENKRLFDEIAARGALMSEFPLDAEPQPGRFPRRNRLISGLSAAVVVVEAAERSGSLSTANHAVEQGREVLAVPGPVSSARSTGCNKLIQQGAKLIQNIEDILEELPPSYRGLVAKPESFPHLDGVPNLQRLSPDESAVLELLDEIEPTHLDDLAERAPFGLPRLQVALFGLEARNAVEATPGGYYVLRPRQEN